MQTVAIEGTLRTEFSKGAVKAIRREQGVPCVMYGGKEVVHFHAHKNAFSKLVYTPDFKVAEITVNGKKTRAIMKDIQFHPVSDSIMHIDFLELMPGHVFKTQVPIKITGSAPGVKVGGKLLQNVRKAKIMATPESLVDSISVDISHLELGQSARVRDIKIPKGITIMSPGGTPVATIEIPRALRSAMNEAKKAEQVAAKKKK